MTVAHHILERPAQFQWDSDSYPCKADNCNCTSVAMIAGFYKDRHFSPTDARKRMQGGSTVCGATNWAEAVRGLAYYGVPASSGWKSVAGVKALLNLNIPVILAVNYGKFPNDSRYITDFNFNGMHAVVACKAVTNLGVPGIIVRDPDHGSPARPERPTSTFWPDTIWVKAYLNSINPGYGLAVWPKYKKVVPTATATTKPWAYRFATESSLTLRSGPRMSDSRAGSVSRGFRFTSTFLKTGGGAYQYGSHTRTEWLAFNLNGKQVWIQAAYCKRI